ncbi:MAG: sugar transferase [Oscillospiraceae bacterium]|nr:sugar transferase [Oscillospiraceae bacterium]
MNRAILAHIFFAIFQLKILTSFDELPQLFNILLGDMSMP